jgi:dynein heavy chain
VHRLLHSEQVDAELDDAVAQRLAILLLDITRNMYLNICRGIFEKDKLLLIFMVSANIKRHDGAISAAEWKCLQIGPGVDPASVEPPAGKEHEWVHGKIWSDLCNMAATMPAVFGELPQAVYRETDKWRQAFVEAKTPHESALPGAWDTKLTSFQRLLVLRAFCEEKLVFGMREFVSRDQGAFFTESPPFDLEGCFLDSQCTTPLIFILSAGSDITEYLMALAKAKGKEGPALKIISLGQGQGPIAERLMEDGRQTGDWVCLQNCHLAVSWLGRMEQNLEAAAEKAAECHEEFRLWLTSMPSQAFPVPVLQNGIKITNEPPKGLRANLMRTFLDMSVADYERCSKPRAFKKFAFALAFFNAICLERRKFGAVGWNIAYEWMNSDLKTGMMQVRNYLEDADEVPYDSLNVMVADVSYGGRVTDQMDKITNTCIMRKYFCPPLMEDDYKFSESGKYFAPPEGSLEDVRQFCARLPVIDTPDTFGLHPNADVTYQQKLTKETLDTIVTMAGSSGGGSGSGDADNDGLVADTATATEERLSKVLPKGRFDLRDSHPSTFQKIDDGSVNSRGVFLSQEVLRWNSLEKVVKASLAELKRAIKGLIVMSGPLELMYNCFVFQRVPDLWSSAGYPCLKPLASWIEDHFQRLDVTKRWMEAGPPPSYWLSGFFFPQGFMTAVKQSYSRAYKIAIDTLTVGAEIMTFDGAPCKVEPADGVYIYGLFMQGARFDRGHMAIEESNPGELFTEMPAIWLKPCPESEYKPKAVFGCPVYKTSLRAGTLSTTGHSTNYCFNVDTPTPKESAHWVRRGCAMLCMLDT